MIAKAFVLALLLPLAVVVVDAKRVKRVQAGKKYKEHDPVDVVVNKVG